MMRIPAVVPGVAAAALVLGAPAAARAQPQSPPRPALPPAASRDVEAPGTLFARSIPVADGSFSPDGFLFAYLFQIPGGFLRRQPQRCMFLLDLGTGENRQAKAPKGHAVRVGGWDPTGRYLLIETYHPDFFSALTGGWTTYHWILDVVTGEFIARKGFTGRRGEHRFLWKQRGTYHGAWGEGRDADKVKPLYEGELPERYRARQDRLDLEDARRLATAGGLALSSDDAPGPALSEVLPRLDGHWTRRGQRDPVISELFGNRPALWAREGDGWTKIVPEVDFVAVLDHDLVLVTAPRGEQMVYNTRLGETLPIAPPPEGWAEVLDRRWIRTEGFYDESDPLPRDLQYRRGYNVAQGTATYFNYVLPDLSRLLVLYSFRSNRRVLRIVDLPAAWRAGGDED